MKKEKAPGFRGLFAGRPAEGALQMLLKKAEHIACEKVRIAALIL